MTSAYIGEGIAKGAEQAYEYARTRPEREMRQKEAEMRQKQAALRLEHEQAVMPLEKEQAELQLQEARMQLRQAHAQSLKNMTYDAFRRYEADGDTRHLNNFLADAKRNPMGQREYGSVLRVDPLTRTPEVEALLRQNGVMDIDSLFNDKEQLKTWVVSTEADGSRELVNMASLYAGTGYTQYMSALELESLNQRAALQKALQGPQKSGDQAIIEGIMDSEGVSYYEATKRYYSLKRSNQTPGGSAHERIATQLMAADDSLTYQEALQRAVRTTETRTAPQKELEQASTIRQQLDESGFFEADLTTPENRRKFGPMITELERLAKVELSTEDKRMIRKLRSLSSLGKEASESITPAETGLLDTMLKGFKQYVSDEVTDGTSGSAAYETFRNSLRNALYGASLTASEIKAFNTAAGTLKQQTGPVLQKLEIQLRDVQEQLKSVYQTNDEYVATYYVGKSLDEIDQIVEAIDERIDLYKTGNKEQPRPSLEEIFGGS